MSTGHECSFCGHKDAEGPFGELHACSRCTLRIAALAELSDSSIDNVWSKDHEAQQDDQFDAFKKGVAAVIGGDAESHLRLAKAYREMGFYRDARSALVVVLRAAPPMRLQREALDLLLTPPILMIGGASNLIRSLAQ